MSSRTFIGKRVASEVMHKLVGQFSAPKDLAAYHGMLLFRCSNLGMKELDHVIGNWAKENVKNLSYQECQQFEEEVLDFESPDLYKLTLKIEVQEELKQFENDKYIQLLRKYALRL